ncbi:carbohydrate ABC transporter permease [Vagococcus penaei]
MFLLAILTIFGPLYMTVMIAVKDPSQMSNVLKWPTTFHWENFQHAWELTDYPQKFKNTLVITVVNLIFTVFTNSLAAYAITRKRSTSKFFNALYYYFISAMFIPFNVIMLPLVKQASFFNLDNLAGIIFIYIIFGLPMNTFLYTGFIKKIPVALDEAAEIDGATPLQTFRYIIFPMLKPVHATVAILSFMWTWNDFLMPLILLSKPEQQTLQLSQYIFQGQFSTQYNLAFASYLLVILPVLLIYIFFQKWIIAGVTDGAVK